jgi:hypothetical protein
VGIADEEIVHYEGEGSGVGVVAEEHRGGGFGEPMLGEKWYKTELRQETKLGKTRPGTVFKTSQKRKGLPWEWRRKGRRPSLVRVGRVIDDTSIRTDSGEWRRAVDYVDGGHESVYGDNGMEEGIDSREGGGVCPHIISYLYPVSPYCPSNSPLSQSVHFIPGEGERSSRDASQEVGTWG